jgi:hypothetical protein
MFIVQTTNGTIVNAGENYKSTEQKHVQLTEDQANHDAKVRNEQAEELGITTRYEVVDIKE